MQFFTWPHGTHKYLHCTNEEGKAIMHECIPSESIGTAYIEF